MVLGIGVLGNNIDLFRVVGILEGDGAEKGGGFEGIDRCKQ